MYRSSKPRLSRGSTAVCSSREDSPPFGRSATQPIHGLDIDSSNFQHIVDFSSDEASLNGTDRQRRDSQRSERQLLQSELAEKQAISSMVNWIESVGKPALETQESLYARLHEKDNDWRRALLELETLKDENRDLQESLKSRPTNEQHENEKGRATRLEVSIQRLEQELNQKEWALRTVQKQAEKIMKNGKQLECNKKQLTTTLNKVTKDFECELQRVNKRNMSLESTVIEKDKDMMELMDAVRESEKKRQEGLLRKVVGRMNRSMSAKRSKRHEPRDRPRSRGRSRRAEAHAAAQAVTPRNLRLCPSNASSIRSAPSRSDSISSNNNTITNRQYTLSNFLESITSLSRRIEETDLEIGGTEKIERSLGAFQEEIQRCIENWSQGEVPHEEILGLMERVFEEWATERSNRLRLEQKLANMREQQHGILGQICGNFKSSSEDPSRPFTILYLPMRIAGWFVWVPIKLGTLSLNTYIYLAKKVARAAVEVLGGGKWCHQTGEDTLEFSPV